MDVTARQATSDRVLEARNAAEDELLFGAFAQSLTAESGTDGFGFENIVGVGISERVVGDCSTGEPAITVFVVRKVEVGSINPNAVVPEAYEGVPTDVIEAGEFVSLSERGRYRPAPLGVSIGHFTGDTGTLGFLAKNGSDLFAVSNNHVLARENQASKGDAILQPGRTDGGAAGNDTLGELTSWIELDFSGGGNPVDAAMATVPAEAISADLYTGGPLVATPQEAILNSPVRKCGRTTGPTRGVVHAVSVTTKLKYPRGVVFVSDQISIRGLDARAFSEAGDSGSLVVDDATNQPVGLLCGGSVRFTLANQIQSVLDGLGVSFAT